MVDIDKNCLYNIRANSCCQAYKKPKNNGFFIAVVFLVCFLVLTRKRVYAIGVKAQNCVLLLWGLFVDAVHTC